MVWFQCSLLIRYKPGNIIGIITVLFSSIRDMAYSLFQKYNARSATYKTHNTTIYFQFRFECHWVWEKVRVSDRNCQDKPENVDWRHIWRFDEIVALEFLRIAVDRWHPKFLLFHLKTSLPFVNMSSAKISIDHAQQAQSAQRPSREIVPHSTLTEHDIMINISLCEVATKLWPETVYAPL